MQKCVVCELETKRSYGNKFPVCFYCYTYGDLDRLFYKIVNNHTFKINSTLQSHLKIVNEFAKDNEGWKEKHQSEFKKLPNHEKEKVNYLNKLVAQIERHILEEHHNYLLDEDKNLSEFDKGVKSAIRFIQYRIHSICD